MRIAYPMRVDAFDKPGGDLFQIQKYIDDGGMANGSGGPLFTGDVITNFKEDFSQFDIVHLTNIDRPVDTYTYFMSARRAGKPIVLSSIHHSHVEIERYERQGRKGAIGLLSGVLGYQRLESLRSLVRSFNRRELLWPTISVILHGMRKAQRDVLSGVDRILVMTNKEQRDILHDFGGISEKSFQLLRNGSEIEPLVVRDSDDKGRDIDVCVVGRIEARKNQIAILEALERLGVAGVFIGHENPNHQAYCKKFKKMIAASRSRYTGGVTHEEKIAIVRRSKVHVSASWFEVASGVDLEAYCAGCSVVSSRCGGTDEILGESARYVDPGSPQEIDRAIASALAEKAAAHKEDAPMPLLETWQDVGLKLAALYQQVLEDSREKTLTPSSLMPQSDAGHDQMEAD